MKSQKCKAETLIYLVVIRLNRFFKFKKPFKPKELHLLLLSLTLSYKKKINCLQVGLQKLDLRVSIYNLYAEDRNGTNK